MKQGSPIKDAIGLREIVALCGMLVLSGSLVFYDWRLAGVVLGALLMMVSIGPLVVNMFRMGRK